MEDMTRLSVLGEARVDVGAKGALVSIALGMEVVLGITLCENMELVVLVKSTLVLVDVS